MSATDLRYFAHVNCLRSKPELCRRSLHTKCICAVGSLPLHFIKHEAHEHTLALRETEINDDYWFYHCAHCGSYLHTLCAQFVEHSKWKIGAKVNLGCHQHLLTVVEPPKVPDLGCNSCGEHVKDRCLECADCTSFVLHKKCAYNEANKLISSLQKDRRLTP